MGSSFSSATKPKIFYPPSPEEILVKKPGGEVGPESLSKLVEEHCPSLKKEFNPPWWLNKLRSYIPSFPNTQGLT